MSNIDLLIFIKKKKKKKNQKIKQLSLLLCAENQFFTSLFSCSLKIRRVFKRYMQFFLPKQGKQTVILYCT